MDIMKLGYDEVINVWSKVDSISQELQEAINGMASELSQMEDNRANTYVCHHAASQHSDLTIPTE